MAQVVIDCVMEKHFDEYESTVFPALVRALESGVVPTRGEVSEELSRVLEIEMPEEDVVVDDIMAVLEKGLGVNGKKEKKEKKGKAKVAPEEETKACPSSPPSKKKGKKEDTKVEPSSPPAKKKGKKEGTNASPLTPPEPEEGEPEAGPAEPVKVQKGKKGKKASSPAPAEEKTETEPEGEATPSSPATRRKRNEVSEFTRLVSMTMKGLELHGSEKTCYQMEPSFKEGSKSRETAANLELFAKFQNKKLSLKEVVENTVKAIEEAEEKVKIVVVSAIVRGFFQKEDRERMISEARMPEPEAKVKRERVKKASKGE